jgi:hypothetical protein
MVLGREMTRIFSYLFAFGRCAIGDFSCCRNFHIVCVCCGFDLCPYYTCAAVPFLGQEDQEQL